MIARTQHRSANPILRTAAMSVLQVFAAVQVRPCVIGFEFFILVWIIYIVSPIKWLPLSTRGGDSLCHFKTCSQRRNSMFES